MQRSSVYLVRFMKHTHTHKWYIAFIVIDRKDVTTVLLQVLLSFFLLWIGNYQKSGGGQKNVVGFPLNFLSPQSITNRTHTYQKPRQLHTVKESILFTRICYSLSEVFIFGYFVGVFCVCCLSSGPKRIHCHANIYIENRYSLNVCVYCGRLLAISH